MDNFDAEAKFERAPDGTIKIMKRPEFEKPPGIWVRGVGAPAAVRGEPPSRMRWILSPSAAWCHVTRRRACAASRRTRCWDAGRRAPRPAPWPRRALDGEDAHCADRAREARAARARGVRDARVAAPGPRAARARARRSDTRAVAATARGGGASLGSASGPADPSGGHHAAADAAAGAEGAG